MNPSFEQLNDYTHYLESQVEKFTAFMLTQKKLNQKHLQVESSLQHILTKVTKVEENIKLLELNQKDNLLDLRKIKAEKQAFKTMELRLQNIEQQLSSMVKIDPNQSIQHISEQISEYQHPSTNYQKSLQKNRQFSPNLRDQDFQQFQKYFTGVFTKRSDFESIVNQTKDDLEFRIKKLQIEIDKSKESFLKLTNHINVLSANFSHENINKKQLKNDNRIGTQYTKDLNIENSNQQNIVTKKQLRKMQKKLQNFFSQKLSQIVTKNLHQSEGFTSEKALKFKKIQQKYDKMTFEQTSQRQTQSERKIYLSDRNYSSQKKIPLFDNQILKEKHMNEIHQNSSKKRKNNPQNNKESPIGMLQSPNNQKQRKSLNNKSQVKKFGKKRSPQRLKKVNVDYMMK